MQVHSFKLRGAYNKMAQLTAEELARGVICSSAGNHAQGVALAAQKLVGIDPHHPPTAPPHPRPYSMWSPAKGSMKVYGFEGFTSLAHAS